MNAEELVSQLKSSEEFFERSTRVLTEEDSAYRPAEGMFTVTQQVAHAAHTIEWFVEGMSRAEGFDMDFAGHFAKVSGVTSLTEARKWLTNAYELARSFYATADLSKALPPGPIMGGQPITSVVGAIIEHTAHHRGALTVYSRLLGKTPIMPYAE